ncbi:MAG TPA: 5'-3' exonuclease H3TH domain-containing protein [Candidatus Eisenbacteria bacterium]|nr:5'-3' exonuclease H3TH domain-containing protein [Candidatus Eisenbacteria bacterium]
MRVHLVDGTYELFRHFFAVPKMKDNAGNECGALVGVIQSLIGMLEADATHLGVATDHVIESFRNDMYAGYKTGAGIDPLLWEQFEPLEAAIAALGVVIWPMVDVEADDALAAAATVAAADSRVKQVLLCSPDKDLAQCVTGSRIVMLDRRSGAILNARGIEEKFGVPPASIPDYLALVGDSADGYPGLPGWGAKSASTVLARYKHLEKIPKDVASWNVTLRGAEKLSAVLREKWDDALLFRKLATLRTDKPKVNVDKLAYKGPKREFEAMAENWRRPKLFARATAVAERAG